ncbi:flagellar biosynthesis anti-sigma factor FlgM [Clostridium oryzae]|uniref:Negative regulator of flagellin synthesis n=1 Tax=Clostridium oryzae TaxID=1450648 RepID=A0A1V4ILF9_9CLOT|nr:flagellar biosynthesis anti-sigma factor FlgM [Clostridium oryzae]OPJ60871.1 anti-sigma-28 factor, FlgM [Clostridium oryzae]
MKIDGIGTNNIIELYTKNKTNNVKPKTNVGEDTIEISNVGRNLNTMSAGLKGDVSEAHIEKLREAVSSGTYKPDAKLVAQKMIDIIKGRDV